MMDGSLEEVGVELVVLLVVLRGQARQLHPLTPTTPEAWWINLVGDDTSAQARPGLLLLLSARREPRDNPTETHSRIVWPTY